MKTLITSSAVSLAIMLAIAGPAQANAILVPGTYGVGGAAKASGDSGSGAGTGWYSYNGPDCGVGGSSCRSGGNVGTFSSSGTVEATGRLTAYTASASAIGGVAAASSADLAAGTVRAFGTSPTTGFFTSTLASAQWYDIVDFNIAGANADTVTTIKFTATFDGTGFDTGTRDRFNNVPSAYVQGLVGIGENFISNPFFAQGLVFANASNNFTPTTQLFTQNRVGYGSWDPASTVNRMIFNGQIDLRGATVQQWITLALRIECDNGAFCDYGNTGTFRFNDLPSNVTFSSASGTFLSGVGPGVGGVPEPASWAMLISGFGLVGAVARRRRVTVAA
jgi:PEP-CTERM motif